MSKTVCYHHDDADGIVSAAIVNHFVKGEKKFIESKYGMNINFDDIDMDDTIYIVDFSFSPSLMDTLCLAADNVIWIDHHASAIKLWNEHLSSMRVKYPHFADIDGIRDISLSGCQLTERYFSDKKTSLVEHIGVYDRWDKENKNVSFNDAKMCMLGLISRGLKPDSKVFEDYFSGKKEDLVDELISTGKVVNEYLNNFQNKKIAEKSFETMIFGHKTIAVNTPIKGADPLLEKYKKCDFDMMCIYFFNGKMWEYSFYTEKDNVDCSVVARSMAKDDTGIGGGHKKAAGCVLKRNLFDNTMKLTYEKFRELNT